MTPFDRAIMDFTPDQFEIWGTLYDIAVTGLVVDRMDVVNFCIGYYGSCNSDHMKVINTLYLGELIDR